jgi:hypothetical protein
MLENGHLYGTQGLPLEEGLWWIFNSCSCVVVIHDRGLLVTFACFSDSGAGSYLIRVTGCL